tara:strand:- start:237 stop:617 length:381 start_codon:yes stop_codon:yes gene_type:complete
MDDKQNKEKDLQEIESYLKSFGYNNENKTPDGFLIYFSVGESGVVDVGIDWPEKNNDDLMYMISTLLFSLNAGLLKNLTLEAINDSIIKYPELKSDVQKVVEKWLEIQNSADETPCIKPTDTLKNI